MMDWTDRHCRMFHHTFTNRALLYTEMVTADAVIHADTEYIIGYDEGEHPLCLQLGGNEPDKLAQASKIAADIGYDEVNLNCGCPSDRVQSGAFGACLMRDAERVADCIRAMSEAVDIPVSVKCRIGVDDDDPRKRLFEFVDTVQQQGCTVFAVHARKAWLKGLSPKENRDVPPLDYDLVHDLKQAFPHLTITLNGGLVDLEMANQEFARFDGVMLGRAAYHTPELLGQVDRIFFNANTLDVDGFEALKRYRPYMEQTLERGIHLHAMTRHMLGLFAGKKGARRWRRILSEQAPGSRGVEALKILDEAVAGVLHHSQSEAV
jgi:tRNA-dihydrouridine synthase A